MKTITFYSYKGGVGRSLALANIASRLSAFNRRVCMVDFDLEAPGLNYKFPGAVGIKIRRGIVDYIYEFTNSGRLPDKISDYSLNIPLPGGKSISLIPAGDTDSSGYWQKLSSINWHALLYQNKHGIEFFLDLKEKIRSEINPDFLLIDSRTGISEMSGISLSLLAEDVVVVAANNRENLLGARRIIQTITNIENSIFNNPPKVTFVLSRIPFTDRPQDRVREQHLIQRVQRDYFFDLVNEINIIHSDRDLEENEQIKIGGSDKDGSPAQISSDYLNLFGKITQNEFSEEEIKYFENIKRSEQLFLRALNTRLMPERIELLTQAIQLNATNFNFYHYRAIAYYEQLDYENTINDCKMCLQFVTFIPSLDLMANTFLVQGNFEEAEINYKKILDLSPNYYNSLLGLGMICQDKNNIEGAVDYFTKAVDTNPEISEAWNFRANAKRLQGKLNEALPDVYKSLELNPNNGVALATLAEINAAKGMVNEFYLNFEMALKIDAEKLQKFLFKDPVYQQFKNEERFIKILERYSIVFPD